MSFDSQLIHTCTIENALTGAINAHGNAEPLFDAPIENVRCRLVESRERVWNDERQESMTQTTYKLFVAANVYIHERARITKVTMDRREVYDSFRVTELYKRNGRNARHVMATLERIS